MKIELTTSCSLPLLVFLIGKRKGGWGYWKVLPGFLLLSFVGPGSIRAQESGSFIVQNVYLFDGERFVGERSVLVVDGVIERVSRRSIKRKGVEVVEGAGRTLIPGLIDAHTHLGEPIEEQLLQFLTFGVTTVVDMFSEDKVLVRLRELSEQDSSAYPSIHMSGVGATAPGGHPSQMIEVEFPTIEAPEEADAFVRARLSEGSRFIKIVYDDLHVGWPKHTLPMISFETMKALVDAAHDQGVIAVVHVGSEEHARKAIEAGADGLVHMFRGRTEPVGFGRLAADCDVFTIPTLSTLYSFSGESSGGNLLEDDRLTSFLKPEFRKILGMNVGGPPELLIGTKAGVSQLIEADASVLVGTDSAVPGTAHGLSVHGEMSLLGELGMTPEQALKAATSLAADAFKLHDRGRIARGYRADLVLVEGDPSSDVSKAREIVAVWKEGVRANRERWEE